MLVLKKILTPIGFLRSLLLVHIFAPEKPIFWQKLISENDRLINIIAVNIFKTLYSFLDMKHFIFQGVLVQFFLYQEQ